MLDKRALRRHHGFNAAQFLQRCFIDNFQGSIVENDAIFFAQFLQRLVRVHEGKPERVGKMRLAYRQFEFMTLLRWHPRETLSALSKVTPSPSIFAAGSLCR